MNWDDPKQRSLLIERVGPEEYERLLKAHHEAMTVATVNGHALRRVSSKWGPLIAVGLTGHAFHTQAEAEAFAKAQPKGGQG